MKHEVVLTRRVHREASDFLLAHIRRGQIQEDLCFALWRPSTGVTRTTAIVFELIRPTAGERELHRNASFDASFLARAIRTAHRRGVGLAFMHSHLTPGWQDMSREDERAERDRISPPARAVGLPVVGLTLGTDGRWSARFWLREGLSIRRHWCDKVRVVGGGLRMTRRPRRTRPFPGSGRLRRTLATWGSEAQADLESLKVGVVGVGSVGIMVAEALARMGVGSVLLIDADRVKQHNLDRLIYAGRDDVGQLKVRLAAKHLKRSATAKGFLVEALDGRVEDPSCFRASLDCDVLFCAVDRPLPKDLLNHIAYAHCIPVVFGGVYAANKANGRLSQAAWSVLTVDPETRCLRCDGQYTTSDVMMERDGSLDEPTYIRNLTDRGSVADGQNVFPFSANLASLMVLEMARLVVAEDWWPRVGGKLHFSFVPRRLVSLREGCKDHCAVRERTAMGDSAAYPFLSDPRSRGFPPRRGLASWANAVRHLLDAVARGVRK